MVSSGWRVFYLDDIIGAGGIVGGSVLAIITNIYFFLLLIIYYLLLLLLPYVFYSPAKVYLSGTRVRLCSTCVCSVMQYGK